MNEIEVTNSSHAIEKPRIYWAIDLTATHGKKFRDDEIFFLTHPCVGHSIQPCMGLCSGPVWDRARPECAHRLRGCYAHGQI
jgi:hypothetical protein